MKLEWDQEAETRYRKFTQESLQERIVTLSALGAFLFPVFIFLDYITQKEHLLQLALYRFSATIIFLISYFLCKTEFIKRHALIMIYFLFSVATTSISLMCVEIGGFNSPYYAGINLILLAAALILPVNEKIMAGLVSAILGIYILINSFWSAESYDLTAAVVNNLYFLITTAFICVTAAYLTEKLRRLSYLRYLELDRAYTYLKGENKSSQDNIQSMVKEISTRRMELEKALHEAEEARSEAQKALQLREDFISLASHELNTPLTSLKLQTQVAQMRLDSTPPAEHSEYYRKIVTTYDSQLKRLIRMVDDMLDVSRIKKGKFDLFFAEVDLGAAIKDIVERTPKNSYEVRLHLKEKLMVSCDLFRIEQVILNLITNAMKYGQGRPIDVSLHTFDGTAVIEVKDQGIGIAPEAQRKIFEQFERAVKPADFSGLGLGLFISRQIVDAHKGQLTVESESGKGSTFRVLLPIHH